MKNFAAHIAGVATLALAVLPVAALSTHAPGRRRPRPGRRPEPRLVRRRRHLPPARRGRRHADLRRRTQPRSASRLPGRRPRRGPGKAPPNARSRSPARSDRLAEAPPALRRLPGNRPSVLPAQTGVRPATRPGRGPSLPPESLRPAPVAGFFFSARFGRTTAASVRASASSAPRAPGRPPAA